MRYEPEHKGQTRERIVRNAARKLRAEGLNGPGVASVMKASGLTVGGFYKHFRSKDELLADAIAQAFSDSDMLYSAMENVPREKRWKELVRVYLSPEHCDHGDVGCPMAALAPEIARAKPSVRKLTGRTMLITGGSAGIGLAFVLKFAELGNEVIVTGRRQRVLDELKAKHPNLHAIQSDVADPAQIAALARNIKDDYPKLDVLMNNAGIMLHKNLKVPAPDLDGLIAEVNINVAGVMRMSYAFLEIIKANKGNIIKDS